jgi:hypothetical protein
MHGGDCFGADEAGFGTGTLSGIEFGRCRDYKRKRSVAETRRTLKTKKAFDVKKVAKILLGDLPAMSALAAQGREVTFLVLAQFSTAWRAGWRAVPGRGRQRG